MVSGRRHVQNHHRASFSYFVCGKGDEGLNVQMRKLIRENDRSGQERSHLDPVVPFLRQLSVSRFYRGSNRSDLC